MAVNENLPVKITKNLKAPKEPGTHYRLMCMTGKNKGTSYYFTKKRIVMGRSDKVDVQILDTKSSREHAELALVGDQYVLSDLGSQNGVIVNDLKVSQHRLVNNDKIIIGQTVYKYNKIEVKESELATIDEEDELEEYEEEEESSKGKKKKGKEKKKPNILVAVIVLAGVLFALPEGQKGPVRGKGARVIGGIKKESIELSNNRSVEIADKDVRNKLKAFIHRGQREYREKNYFRAIEQFELALILVPNHGDASFYLKKTRDSLEAYIQAIKAKAKQDEDALKYGSAMNQHCAIITFLQDYPEDERYKEAEQQVSILEEKLGYEKGEYKCF
jgi:hypothetical protein